MTTFADLMTADLAMFFDVDAFATTITYKGTSIPAIVDYVRSPDDGSSSKFGATITVKASDVPDPGYRDAVTIDGEAWLTANPEEASGDGFTWIIPLVRDERPKLK